MREEGRADNVIYCKIYSGTLRYRGGGDHKDYLIAVTNCHR